MNHLKRLLLSMLVASAAPLVVAAPQPPRDISVDCDNGGNLQRAVDTLANRGGGIVRFTGTCEGVHVDSPLIEIVGVSPTLSRIDAGSGTAIHTTEPGHLSIRNVHLAGGQGVYAIGHQRVVFINDCEIDAGIIALRVDTGAGVVISDSDLTGTQFAIRSVAGTIVVERSTLHDSNFGARVFDAELFLIDSDVTASSIVGVQAERSTVLIQGGRLSDNGNAHISAMGGSRLDVFNVEIGGPNDLTTVAFRARDGAKIGLFGNDPALGVWGSAIVTGDSFVALDGVVLHGSILLSEFSRLVLNGIVSGGNIQCKTAADATCDHAGSALTLGCASALASCVPSQQAADRGVTLDPPQISRRAESLRRLGRRAETSDLARE